MSGAAAAGAYRAYARSTSKRIDSGDLVLVHCNAHAEGYWTDVTRTYCVGDPDNRQTAIYDAIFAARQAALAGVRPGVPARDVDRAARAVLTERGFGAAFKHSTGHGAWRTRPDAVSVVRHRVDRARHPTLTEGAPASP